MLMMIFSCPVFADMASLTNYVNSINSQNGGNGLSYTYQYSAGVEFRVTVGAGQTLDLSAYDSKTRGTNTFQSFCAESNAGVYTNTASYGKLSLRGNYSYNSSNKALSVGAAYLYKMFAVGDLTNYNYATGSNATAFRTSLWAAMGSTTVSNWANDAFLSQLLAINSDQNFWLGAYDVSQYYSFIGDYTVLIMDCWTTTGYNTQDVFYLVNGSGGSTSTPEPTTLAMWFLGTGLLPLSYRVRKNLWPNRNIRHGA